MAEDFFVKLVIVSINPLCLGINIKVLDYLHIYIYIKLKLYIYKAEVI